MANPTFIGQGSNASDGTTAVSTLAVDIHADSLEGDLLVIVTGNDANTNTVQFSDTFKPSGSTFVDTDGNANSDCHYGVFYKVLTAGDISAGSITHVAEGTYDMYGWNRTYRDFNASNVINQVGVSQRSSGSSIAVGAVTTDVDDCISFAIAAFDGGDGSFTWTGTGWNKISDLFAGSTGGNGSGSLAHFIHTGQGSSGTATCAFGISDGFAGVQFAIEPGSDGGIPVSGLPPSLSLLGVGT